MSHTAIDKSAWGDGPWQSEPDELQFEHAGLQCVVLRNARGGNLNGYVAVPESNPWHGKAYGELPVDVHGGLTFSGEMRNRSGYFFGFDCAHAWDLCPGWTAYPASFGWPTDSYEVYRDLAYVESNVRRLADQLASVYEPPVLLLTFDGDSA